MLVDRCFLENGQVRIWVLGQELGDELSRCTAERNFLQLVRHSFVFRVHCNQRVQVVVFAVLEHLLDLLEERLPEYVKDSRQSQRVYLRLAH